MNITGFVLITIALPFKQSLQSQCGVWLVLLLSVGLCISLFDDVEYYGFSGVLHGYLLYLLLQTWAESKFINSCILSILAAKIIFEQMGFGTAASAQIIEAPVAVSAHLYGSITGVAMAFTHILYQRRAATT